MKAAAIIEQVRRHGGDLRIQGRDIVLTAPQPLSAELIAQVREHKAEILEVLDGVESLVEEFQKNGRIRIDSDWAGAVWLVASVSELQGDEDGSVYFPTEIPFMVSLSEKERKLVDGFKRCFGGTIDVKPWDETR